jgi:hypothetical protein
MIMHDHVFMDKPGASLVFVYQVTAGGDQRKYVIISFTGFDQNNGGHDQERRKSITQPPMAADPVPLLHR